MKRLHYIDWLRVLAVLLLFPFHTGRVFNYGEAFYVKGPETSIAVSYLLGFIDVWHMPLLFLLAGASTYFALRRRSAGRYIGERAKRLLVPFAFGVLAWNVPQTWYGGRFNSGYTGSLIEYVTSGAFLVPNIKDGGDYYGGLGIAHLWFVLFLFVVSLLALPLFLWWRGERGQTRAAAFSRVLSHPAGWLLAAFLILVGDALPDLAGINPFYYLAFFVLGYSAMADEAFMDSAERYRWIALASGVALSVWWIASGPIRDPLPDPSWARAGLTYLGMLAAWLVCAGLLGLGRRHLDRRSPALDHLAEASYPLYILHQTVIVVLAFYIVQLPAAWWIQWAVLLAASVAATFGLYEVVWRVGVLRFLFGMRPAPRAERAG